MLGVLAAATALGTAGTLAGLHHLLRPIPRTAQALRRYAEERALPDLPTGYDDDAGRLMRDTQTTLTRLDELAGFRDRLFSVVLHDLRSPATSVLLAADALGPKLAGKGPEREAVEELIDTIRHSTREQLALSSILLEQVRRDSVQLNVQPETVRPAALLERAAAQHRLAAELRGIELRIDLEDDPGMLRTDQRLARQVLQNLVANAVAFSPEDRSVVLSTARRNAHVVLGVRDEGPGMTADELETLFEPFHSGASRRVASTEGLSALKEGGFGLGLWIAKTFTQMLGGVLEADSTPGEGTTFRVCLPTQPAHEADAPASLKEPSTAVRPSESAAR